MSPCVHCFGSLKRKKEGREGGGEGRGEDGGSKGGREGERGGRKVQSREEGRREGGKESNCELSYGQLISFSCMWNRVLQKTVQGYDQLRRRLVCIVNLLL